MSSNTNRIKTVCLQRPSGHDFLTATVIDGLNQLDYVDNYCHYRSNNAIKIATQKFIVERCKEADVIFLFSNRDWMDRKRLVVENGLIDKTIYVDGSDYGHMEDQNALSDYRLMFKRELFLEDFVAKKDDFPSYLASADTRADFPPKSRIGKDVFPLSFAVETAYLKYNTDNKDIFLSCTLRRRQEVVNKINELKNKITGIQVGQVSSGGPGTSATHESKHAYFDTLARSKLSISFPGGGWDTGRFWEILANRALLFSPSVQIMMPNPYLPDVHYIKYDNVEELEAKVLYYHEYQDEIDDMVNNGFDHTIKYHTSKARVEYMLDIIARKTGLFYTSSQSKVIKERCCL